jgi:Flp pilus assembly protein TadG
MTYRIGTAINKLLSDRRGSIGFLFALTTIPVTLITGMAVDYAEALRARERLQHAVDASASAGARLPATANQNRLAQAQSIFNANVSNSALSGVVPQIQASNAEVSVQASYTSPTRFMGIIGVASLEVSARTTARSQIQNGGMICLLALNPTTENGLHLQGINKLSSDNCWAWVNSTSASAINAVGASTGSAQGFCSAGGVAGAEHFTPAPYTGCDPFADPFKTKINGYNAPSACTYNNVQLSSGTYTLNPGVYCGNTIFKPNAVVTMNPGLYVFRDGYLQVQAQASLTGNGVTLFFTHTGTRMEIRGGADVDLKAPASGDLAGFVIVDRKIDSYDPSIRESVIQGGGRLKIEGVVYAPQWKLSISGNGELNEQAQFFTMIADSFYMEGNGKLYIRSDAEAAGLPNIMPKIKNGPLLLN